MKHFRWPSFATLGEVLPRLARLVAVLGLLAALLRGDVVHPSQEDLWRRYTRPVEFEFVSWMLRAWWVKFSYGLLAPERYIRPADQKAFVLDYMDLVARRQRKEDELKQAYGDPNLTDREARIAALQRELQTLRAQQRLRSPIVEQIIQAQVTAVLADLDLGYAGWVFPPVLYREADLPDGLVISPREVIRMDAFIPLVPDLPLEEQVAIEENTARAFDVSTLVVPIGGIALYPTMVMPTSDLNWLVETVAHEWTHTFFDLRPLGWRYYQNPTMRTINETAASIAGREIGRMVMARFYPERLPPPPPKPKPRPRRIYTLQPKEEPAFDFNREMRITRQTVDALLAEGKVEEAEAYMEARRRFFWEHGYRIRKLNQAYFAFYGAYAEAPGGGPAGEDPVGIAVRAFWRQTGDITVFLKRIAWVRSLDELVQWLAEGYRARYGEVSVAHESP